MRILLDENVPIALRHQLSGHAVKTIAYLKLKSAPDLDVLKQASDNFDVLITADQNMIFQQNVSKVAARLIILPSTRINQIMQCLPEVLLALQSDEKIILIKSHE
jgi:predicted nuclease of predicted toxin-antitoxin system